MGWIAIAGLALSIAVLVVVLSVVNGFERELEQRLFAILPHVSVVGRGPVLEQPDEVAKLEQLPGVLGVAPFVQSTALVAVPGAVRGAQLMGIDPRRQPQISRLEDFVRWDSIPQKDAQAPAVSDSSLMTHLSPGAFGVILGVDIAADLDVSLGDRITVVLPQASVSLVGVIPRQKRVRVVGLLTSESELDSRAAYLHINDVQRLLRLGELIHGYHLRLGDLFQAQDVGLLARTAVGPQNFGISTWIRSHGNLHHAIVIQKQTMFLLLTFLVGVAAFNLISSLLMVVNQRSPDVAIMRTMGAPTTTFVGAFTILALLLGGLGLVAGLLLGCAVAQGLPTFFTWVSHTFDLELMNEYFVNYLPVEIRASDLWGISGVTAVLTLLSALYPAWRVARTRPSEVLAHE